MYGCGYNQEGALGLGNNTDQYSFIKLPNPFGKGQKKENLVMLPFMYSTMLYDKEKKSLFVCGRNAEGQLGLGNTSTINNY